MQACGLRPWCLYLQGLCLQTEPFPGSKSVWPWSPRGLTVWSAGRDFSQDGVRRQEDTRLKTREQNHLVSQINTPSARHHWQESVKRAGDGRAQARRTCTPDHQGSMSPTLQPASRELPYDHPPQVLSKDDLTKYFLCDSSLKENFGKADAERAHSNHKRSDKVCLK